MTLQDLYTLFYEYRLAVLLVMLFAPWIALGICIAVPGYREEPLVLNINLSIAVFSLVMAIGYVWYALMTAGISKIIQEADTLLLLAPFYYVGVSLWVTRQRLPLAQIPAVRIVQGAALIGAGYLGVVWFLSKLRIVIFSFLPFPILVLVFLGIAGIGYLGYLRLTGKDLEGSSHSPVPPSSNEEPYSPNKSIDDELDALRRDLNK